ncbi:quinone oxidoreductase family protein [Novosphingobium cyanobacteriorum]|uniref:Zinc-binding dehydrogenase n=1 Tax=Novosphingobium cyanobacteriorum TaxID=3024215 RepID=A0ABT6CL04_9SPHN|nr:zinc-binding dehydrogenase [Novosphingobium cyanobacteriorum]MDF8334603.1 zinc-binding dehydrogenase [Novosphingobium cyanobacteriorum]
MMSRTWRIHETNGPDSLVLENLPIPEPGPGEVRVKTKAIGMNRSDLLWITAGFFTPVLPSRVGAEFCGIVDAVGEGVNAFKPGDRVSNLPHPLTYAHFAEHTIVTAEALVHTPACLSDAEGAAFIFTHLTQMLGLVEAAGLRAGMTVLVSGATSANGNSAVLLAKLIGAQVIATSRSSAGLERLLALGADAVVATSEESLSERVASLTGGKGADVVYDCVGGTMTDEILQSCAMNAYWLMFGYLDPTPVTVNWPLWFYKQPKLHIFSTLQYSGSDAMGMKGHPLIFRRAIDGLLALVGSGKLAVPIGTVYQGIEQVQTALRTMDANAGGGKIVITI